MKNVIYDMSNWDSELATDEDPEEIVKECSYCKGTGIDRHVEADCLKCYGEGYV